MSEDGRKQQAKLKELGHIAEKLGCTLPQLAVGERDEHGHTQTLLCFSTLVLMMVERHQVDANSTFTFL